MYLVTRMIKSNPLDCPSFKTGRNLNTVINGVHPDFFFFFFLLPLFPPAVLFSKWPLSRHQPVAMEDLKTSFCNPSGVLFGVNGSLPKPLQPTDNIYIIFFQLPFNVSSWVYIASCARSFWYELASLSSSQCTLLLTLLNSSAFMNHPLLLCTCVLRFLFGSKSLKPKRSFWLRK